MKIMLMLFFVMSLMEVNASAFCVDPNSIGKKVDSCEENYAYTDAAYQCADQFYLNLETKEEELLKRLSKQNSEAAAKGNRQAQDLDTAKKGYSYSAKEFADLINQGNQTKAYLQNYLSNIVYPEDWDAPPDVIGDGETFLNNSNCYSDARDEIKSLIADLANDIEDLKAAKQASLGKKAGSAKRESQLKGERAGTEKVSKDKVGQGAPDQKVTEKQGKGPSDISGVNENEKKRKETEKIIKQNAPK